MKDLTESLYYHTWLDDPFSRERRAIVDIHKLAQALPHGSGIDGDYTITLHRNGSIRISGEYHGMNGDGYYVGWSGFHFRIYKATADETHPLRGPCEGQTQYTKIKGEVYISPVQGTGNGELNGDLTEQMDYALFDAFPFLNPTKTEVTPCTHTKS